jgi:hypothetical protein
LALCALCAERAKRFRSVHTFNTCLLERFTGTLHITATALSSPDATNPQCRPSPLGLPSTNSLFDRVSVVPCFWRLVLSPATLHTSLGLVPLCLNSQGCVCRNRALAGDVNQTSLYKERSGIPVFRAPLMLWGPHRKLASTGLRDLDTDIRGRRLTCLVQTVLISTNTLHTDSSNIPCDSQAFNGTVLYILSSPTIPLHSYRRSIRLNRSHKFYTTSTCKICLLSRFPGHFRYTVEFSIYNNRLYMDYPTSKCPSAA